MSRSINIRESARKIITNICETLGSKYLPFIIKEIKLNLKKGYQVIFQHFFYQNYVMLCYLSLLYNVKEMRLIF